MWRYRVSGAVRGERRRLGRGRGGGLGKRRRLRVKVG